MVIKPSSLAVIITAFLVAGTLIWVGIEQRTADKAAPQLAGTDINVAPAKLPTVKIGWVGPLSGDDAKVGESIKHGVELAVDDLAAGYLDIIFADVSCNTEDAIKAVDKLLLEDRVQAIISAVCSTAGLAINPLAEQSHVVVISPNNTTAQFTDAGDYIFRTISSNLSFGKFAAQTIINEDIKNIAILHSDDEISQDSHKAFLQHFRGPATITISKSFSPGTGNHFC
jgi:branched-chain amino acid transport system substrate-binding protein